MQAQWGMVALELSTGLLQLEEMVLQMFQLVGAKLEAVGAPLASQALFINHLTTPMDHAFFLAEKRGKGLNDLPVGEHCWVEKGMFKSLLGKSL